MIKSVIEQKIFVTKKLYCSKLENKIVNTCVNYFYFIDLILLQNINKTCTDYNTYYFCTSAIIELH